jgi:hypothetical protein
MELRPVRGVEAACIREAEMRPRKKDSFMRTLAILAAALVSFRIISNLIYNHRFMAAPAFVRRLNRRYL